jgi:hypothetical protein
MRPDRDQDWVPRLHSLAQSETKERRPELQAIRRAALHASEITGDEHWDFFLSMIKEKIEAKQAEVESASDRLINSDIFTTEDLINAKLTVRLLGREIEVLQWVIELPVQLQEQGDKASELLGTIDKSSD